MNTLNINEQIEISKRELNRYIDSMRRTQDSKIAGLKKLEFLNGVEFPEDINISTYMLGNGYGSENYGYILINCDSFQQMYATRKVLKKVIKGYSDKVSGIFPSGDKAIVDYETSCELIQIRVKVPVEEVPKSIFPSKDCGFKKVTKTEYEFSCSGRAS